MALSETRESDEILNDEEPFDYQEYDKDSELTSFLEKEDLLSLQSGLSNLNVNLSYLQYLETEQLNILCDKLQLKIGSSTRLQFTRAVIKIQSEFNQIKENKKQTIVDELEKKEKEQQQQQQHQNNKNYNLSMKRLITPKSNNNTNTTFTTNLASPRSRGYDYLIKCILLGDSDVGKSCILVRYIDDLFKESSMFTVGIDYRMKSIELGDDLIKYQIWDTAGQEKYRTIISAYYRGIDAVLLCYDITNRTSFENITCWIQQVEQYSSDNVFMMLVATKLDLITDKGYQREITTEEGQQLANEYGIKFCEVSSKSGHGISSLFLTTASYCILRKKQQKEKIDKQRALTQERVNLMISKVDQDDDENVGDKFVKKKCCNVYI